MMFSRGVDGRGIEPGPEEVEGRERPGLRKSQGRAEGRSIVASSGRLVGKVVSCCKWQTTAGFGERRVKCGRSGQA
jgi:hypothetical protein